jgi:Zn-finger nucleic acid-binding protein/predicted RNA-binding Zn-ribbon protein involved in translation (DUF1610 family)
MAAQSLNCPNCGAAVSSESTRCAHCNSKLATVACPSCFGMIFQGAKFCSHCGAAAHRALAASNKLIPCPRCRVNTQPVLIGKNTLRECLKCEGIWADAETLHHICTDREQQSAVLGTAMTIEPQQRAKWEEVRYVPCPICKQLMHRVNFAKCSTVIVDVCKPHGTWFDKEELRRVVEFIRAGGFDKARAMEITELKRQRRELETTTRSAGVMDPHVYSSRTTSLGDGVFEFGIDSVVDAIASSFFDGF